eukprot:4948539-Ditylum_brightwellii.AAC.1
MPEPPACAEHERSGKPAPGPRHPLVLRNCLPAARRHRGRTEAPHRPSSRAAVRGGSPSLRRRAG